MQFKYAVAYEYTHHKYAGSRAHVFVFTTRGLIITLQQQRDDEPQEINGEKKRKEQKRVMDYVDCLIGFLWRKVEEISLSGSGYIDQKLKVLLLVKPMREDISKGEKLFPIHR